MIIQSVNHCLNQIKDFLIQINENDYSMPCFELSNSSIGEHTRHIIEMFQCLDRQYASGIINYDMRDRNKQIETSTSFAISQIELLLESIKKPNKDLLLQESGANEIITVNTNYFREIVYNLEHCIHHQALIKIGLVLNFDYKIDENFGVAFSTIQFRNNNNQ